MFTNILIYIIFNKKIITTQVTQMRNQDLHSDNNTLEYIYDVNSIRRYLHGHSTPKLDSLHKTDEVQNIAIAFQHSSKTPSKGNYTPSYNLSTL